MAVKRGDRQADAVDGDAVAVVGVVEDCGARDREDRRVGGVLDDLHGLAHFGRRDVRLAEAEQRRRALLSQVRLTLEEREKVVLFGQEPVDDCLEAHERRG